jgi:hypothetical protein
MEGGYHRAKFVLPVRTPRFARMVLRKWPKHGWTLGRGDSEPGEVEDSFLKSPAAGAFKANDVNCSGGKTILYLVLNPTATS